MDFVGLTFDNEMREFMAVETVKISKWINCNDLSLDVVFRLTVRHNYKDGQFKKIRRFYAYFHDRDFRNLIIDHSALALERKRLEKSLSEKKDRKFEEDISPLEGYLHPILTEELVKEDNGQRKRIRIDLLDYDLSEDTTKRNILFPLKFKESIFSYDSVKPREAKIPWYYDCLIEPYLLQTLKWGRDEFVPSIESLELWLQIPVELYKSLSKVNVQPVGHFEQMFLLGKKVAKRFKNVGQPLADEKTLCINWFFPDMSATFAEEIEVTCGLREFEIEEQFVRRFDDNPGDIIPVLRELLYKCKAQTLDINRITFGISDRNVKKILEIFNVMVFQRNRRSMKENLEMLQPELEHFRKLRHGEEFFHRYDVFHDLIQADKPEDFFSDGISSKLRRFDEFEDLIDPEYKTLMESLSDLAELTKKFKFYDMDKDKLRYKNEILSMIEKLSHQWIWPGKLTHPDKYILIDILTNWKHVIEREYEEQIPKPKIEAAIKAKRLALSETIGIVVSIQNTGNGDAADVYARLLQGDDYEILTEESETKPFLTSAERPFEPELLIRPKNEASAVISYEICYEDILRRKGKDIFEEFIEFVREEISPKKIENPYIVGDVVRDNRMFYGRQELLESIIDNFEGKYQINPVFLYGQRRTGKTSTLIQLKKKLGKKFAPVLFNTQEIFGKKTFYQDLMEKIREELGFGHIEIPDIKEDPLENFKENFYNRVKQGLEGKKVVVMIDEYQLIDELITKGDYQEEIIDFLNALVQDGEIKFIFAGSLQPKELENQKWMELMKFFTTMEVSFLERNDTVDLITEPVRGSMEYDEGGIEKIISLSGCHPCFVQLICHVMVEHHNHDEVTLIGYNSINNHLSDYFERGYNVLSDILEAQTDDIQRKVLFYMYDLMEKKKKISVHKSDIEWSLMNYEDIERIETIDKSLDQLKKREIIRETTGHPDYYEFMVDLYRHWVKRNIRPG
jgi:hypothetical protein